MSRARANGEGSIYPYRNGFAAYAWVTTPAGTRQRKYVYGKTARQVHDEVDASCSGRRPSGPVATTGARPSRGFLATGSRDRRAEPGAADRGNYEMFVRLYIVPGLGRNRLDRLSVPRRPEAG